jgi:hypothetical protein
MHRNAKLPILAALLPLLGVAGCTTTSRVEVSSAPSGARILIDGVDSGQTTPSSVVLSTSRTEYTLTLEKPGFNPASRTLRYSTDVDVMDADEAVGSICCAPFCCGLPLLNFLHPVDVSSRFVPSRFNADLEVAGQGARLSVTPTVFEAYLDGKLVALLEGNYLVTTPGDHELEIRAAGYRDYSRAIHVDERVYQRIEIELPIEGQGLLVSGSPIGAKVVLDDQYRGNLAEEPKRVRAEPGPHMLRVELEGFRPWQDVVQIAADRYQEIVISLVLEGQGLRVRKPEGLPARTPEIQILVDGQLQGSAFDTPVRVEPGLHEVEIRVGGRETRQVQVRVTADSWIDLEPGPALDPGGDRPSASSGRQGIRLVPPIGFDVSIGPEKIQILVDGSLRGQNFDRVIALEAGEYEVEVRIEGYRTWSQRVKVERRKVLEVWPDLRRR